MFVQAKRLRLCGKMWPKFIQIAKIVSFKFIVIVID